ARSRRSTCSCCTGCCAAGKDRAMAKSGYDARDAGGVGVLVRRGVVLVGLLVLALVVASSSCARVDAGHVGIRVKLAGCSRGVQDAPVVTGWVVFNPLTESIVEFPTSVQNVVWTRDVHEGSPNDESLTFASSEGVTVNADVGLAFHVDGDKAPRLYGA